MTTPYFAITQFLLKRNEFTVISSITALYEQGNVGFAFFLATIVVGTQALKWLVIAFVWYKKMTNKWLEKSQSIIEGINKWCMLDVFTIGFALFVMEADHIVQVESREGLNYLWVAISLNIALDVSTSFSINRHINSIK
jgi:uncharacterized paraquat-inducible protein A